MSTGFAERQVGFGGEGDAGTVDDADDTSHRVTLLMH